MKTRYSDLDRKQKFSIEIYYYFKVKLIVIEGMQE